ncbi:MAG: precorrin-6y C5,15-methyltransferase (decarboxylating) subunit CbiE [Desulfobacteraceae bacterium]|nr:precorrin-6y C5,15-methyltransferase (decarboxylating) subunit CbiE [Desulfobacteraceae bacterium]
MEKVIIIGVGLSRKDLTQDHLSKIRSADILVGSKRFLDWFDDLDVLKKELEGNLTNSLSFVANQMHDHRIVVLASGDPLFFGIGALLARRLGKENIEIYPNVSSLAAAFTHLKEPWGNVRVVSLHGRYNFAELFYALSHHETVAVFTDSNNSPEKLADLLIENNKTGYKIAVFEKLGEPEETIGWYTLEQAAARSFQQPNVVVIRQDREQCPAFTNKGKITLGMDDYAFEHEAGLITKAEVRAVTLVKLRLQPGMILWDLGAGSGAVGIEASVLLGQTGHIVAVEKKSHRVDQITANARKWGVYNLETVQAELPDGMENLPTPDRIFVGGAGSGLVPILEKAAERLSPEGILVVNTVLLDNLPVALKTLQCAGLETEVVQVQVSQAKSMPWSSRFEAKNPVWIISGKRIKLGK